MRKIISIMVALGLVLAFTVVAMPTAGAACTAKVTLTQPCAGATSTYTVNLTAPVTLQPGDLLSFDFGDGTTFGTFIDGDVTVNTESVLKTKVTVDAVDTTKLWVEIPAAAGTIFIGQTVIVVIPKVKNPAGGDYVLSLDYKESCCEPVVFDCANYSIKPAKSTYKYILDFGPTYAGIAEDFVPPFQACGQCGYGNHSTDLNATINVGWMTKFDVTLIYDVLGCAGGCTANVSNVFYVKSGPEDATISMFLGDEGGPYNWPPTFYQITLDDDWDPEEPWGRFPTFSFPLAADHNATSQGWIHFDTPGDYEICFQLECPDVEQACSPTIEGGILAERCIDAKVHQWKEAFKIPLYAKWNLVSLPFKPFDSDIDAMLESFPDADKIMAIWHYDQCADDWLGYPDQGLTDIVDGDAYWIRLPYNPPALNTSAGVWWVWGTDRPYEEAPVPFNYEVCEGWNMVGFTATWNMTACSHEALSATDKEYLWNWWDTSFSFADYSRIYGWDPATQTWDWQLPGSATLVPGEGYWIAFEQNGFIYP